MRLRHRGVCLGWLVALANAANPKAIVLMLGDDYGYNNVGFAHGSENGNPEMKTPNMDALARTGIVLDRFYTYKYCSPTRSSLMSGRLPPHVNQNNLNNDIQAKSGPDLRFTLLPKKLKEAGYYTAMVGKSHLGARSPANLPINRGFDYHFGFLKGGEDHYNQGSGSKHGIKGTVDLWSGHELSNETGIYSGYLYTAKAVKVIENFASDTREKEERGETPATGLFMYLAWHNTHTPLECPTEWEYPAYYNNSFQARMTYNCMAHILDDGIGNVTSALKQAGLWDDTLLFFAGDNGGWAGSSGANNYPLRGSKTSDFEGGVRVVSFLNGGKNVLPDAVRGGRHTGYISIADWYGTLLNMVGVDPTDDVPGLPPVDSNNFWPSILIPNATESGRDELWLAWSCVGDDTKKATGCGDVVSIYNTTGDPTAGQNKDDMGYIAKNWKIVVGKQNSRGVWFGPVYPNGTADGKDLSCVDGCLFDISKDPTEHQNLKNSEPEVWKMMLAKLLAAGKTLYQTDYGEPDVTCISGEEAAKLYVGHNTCIKNVPGYNPSWSECDESIPREYLGPMCFKQPPQIPTPPPTPPPPKNFQLAVGSGASKLCLTAGNGPPQKTAPLLLPCTSNVGTADDYVWSVGVGGFIEVGPKSGSSSGFYLKLNETQKTGGKVDFCKRGSVYLNNEEGSAGQKRQGFILVAPPSPVGDFAATNKLLKSSFCEGICLVASSTGANGGMSLELANCDSAAAAAVWRLE